MVYVFADGSKTYKVLFSNYATVLKDFPDYSSKLLFCLRKLLAAIRYFIVKLYDERINDSFFDALRAFSELSSGDEITSKDLFV